MLSKGLRSRTAEPAGTIFLDTTEATLALLEKHGFDVVYEESAGGHTWINWRECLTKFAPQLFR